MQPARVVSAESAPFTIRPARLDDGPVLQHVQARCPQGVAVKLETVNEPDFFGRVKLQSEWLVFVAEHEGRVVGSAACAIKDALVNGRVQRVSYELQVFVDPPARRSHVARHLLEALHVEARNRGACLSYILVLDGNRPMHSLLDKLGYRVHRKLTTTAFLVHSPRRVRTRDVVRPATPRDLDAVAALLERTWSGHELAQSIPPQRLEEVIQGAGCMRPLLVLERAERIVACAGVLDFRKITRVVVRSLSPGLKALGMALRVGGLVMSLPGLPQPGDTMSQWILTPLGFESPGDLRPLVETIYEAARAERVAQLSTLWEPGHPVAHAFRGMLNGKVTFNLLTRSLSEGATLDATRPVAIPGEDL